MTDKEKQIRITMWESVRALWPIILPVFLIIGAVYVRAEFAVALVRDVRLQIASCYVLKTDYTRDMDRILDKLDKQDQKIDYIIQLQLKK
jgi:hypothetical protein